MGAMKPILKLVQQLWKRVSWEHFRITRIALNQLIIKIPEYAREYKKEYLFIRGLNKEFKYFIDKLDDLNNGLFESHRADRIKNFMKRFWRAQETGKLKDISEFEIEYDIVFNLNKIKNKLNNIDQYLDFILNCYHKEDLIFINTYPGFIDFYYYFNLFFTKLNIKYEYDSDSDSDDFQNKIGKLNETYL